MGEAGRPRPTPALADRLNRRRSTAEDKSWWAFQPVRRPSVPEVKNSRWSANPVDRFILTRLETEGLKPSPEAERRALIRRAYFDLIGLPPSAEEVALFVSDPAPDAYEKVVDGLLRNPHYGEKWGRHWLDLVRYAESDGFKLDEYRPAAWRYRDYVIRSFDAGLLKDLKARGLLDSTLVTWGGEFGRTPMSEKGDGRDHNPTGFTMWMAGGGVKGGQVIGETDELGLHAVRDRLHMHDLHATILYLMGLDHAKLVYRHQGRPERLTLNEGEPYTKITG